MIETFALDVCFLGIPGFVLTSKTLSWVIPVQPPAHKGYLKSATAEMLSGEV